MPSLIYVIVGLHRLCHFPNFPLSYGPHISSISLFCSFHEFVFFILHLVVRHFIHSNGWPPVVHRPYWPWSRGWCVAFFSYSWPASYCIAALLAASDLGHPLACFRQVLYPCLFLCFCFHCWWFWVRSRHCIRSRCNIFPFLFVCRALPVTPTAAPLSVVFSFGLCVNRARLIDSLAYVQTA